MRSVRTRLLAWISVLLLPLAVGAGWLLVGTFGTVLRHDTDVALDEEADTVAALLGTPNGRSDLPAVVQRVAGETDLGTPKYVAVFEAGHLLAESPAGAGARLQSGDDALRIVRHAADGIPALTIAVGVPVAADAAATARLRSLVMFGVPVLLLVVCVGLWVVIGWALRPLSAAARQLDRIALENLSARIDVGNADDEIGRLVAVVNAMLDRLDRAVEQLRRFTADAAHELRTPLTVLRTGLDLAVSQERSAGAYRAALEEALAATDRVCHLAEDLLTLSRLEVAERPAHAEAVDIAEVLEELADAWSAAAEQRGVGLTLAVRGPLPVLADAGDLYRLFANLLGNAIRATPAGGGVALRADRSDDEITVTVSDTGPGVAAEDLERVFDRFYRGHRERPDGGTGLGLSIAREIVRLHGGRLTLTNLAPRGCTARVALLAAPAQQMREAG